MGTILQFRPRAQGTRQKTGIAATLAEMTAAELRATHDRLVESDYALSAEERLRALVEIEMKRRDILPSSAAPIS